jgi:hypothetical protein
VRKQVITNQHKRRAERKFQTRYLQMEVSLRLCAGLVWAEGEQQATGDAKPAQTARRGCGDTKPAQTASKEKRRLYESSTNRKEKRRNHSSKARGGLETRERGCFNQEREHTGAQHPTCRAAEDQRAATGLHWGAPRRELGGLMQPVLVGYPLRAPQRHGEARVQLLLLDGEPRSPSWNRRATAQPRPQAKLPSAAPPLPGMRPHLAALPQAGTWVVECMGALANEKPRQQWTKRLWLHPWRRRTRRKRQLEQQARPDNSGNEGDGDYQGSGAAEQGTTTRTAAATLPRRSVQHPQPNRRLGGSRSLNPPPSLSPPPLPYRVPTLNRDPTESQR